MARSSDLRADLEAVAEGRTLADQFSKASRVDAALVEQHQADFRAWQRFASASAGEPLPAPSEILTPLP